MQPGARLASFGKPLAVLAVVAIGAAVFTAAAGLLGTRQPAALLHAAEGMGGKPADDLHALPMHRPSAERTTAIDDLIAGLKQGAFGVTFARPPSSAMATSSVPGATDALVPSVLVDVQRPPLRIEIMGLDSMARPVPASTGRGRP